MGFLTRKTNKTITTYEFLIKTNYMGSRLDGDNWITTWWEKDLDPVGYKLDIKSTRKAKKDFSIINNDRFISTEIETYPSDTLWLVWVLYSVGTDTTRDYNKFHSLISLHKGKDYASAVQVKDFIEKEVHDSITPKVHTISTIDNQKISVYPHMGMLSAESVLDNNLPIVTCDIEGVNINKVDVYSK